MKIAVILISVLLVDAVCGQQIIGISYNIAVPAGKMQDFINHTSLIGMGVEGKQFYNDNAAFGVSFCWNKFSSSNNQFAERRMESFPLTMNIGYYTGRETSVYRPYAALNGGMFFINAWDGPLQDKRVHFGIAPELGVLAKFFHDLNIMLFLRYNYPFGAENSTKYTYISFHFTFVSISIL